MKLFLPTFLLLSSSLFFFSCSKIKPKDLGNKKIEIDVSKGCLKFEDFNHLSETAEKISKMKPDEKEQFLNDFQNFTSLGSVFKNIVELEEKRVEYFFKGLDPELTGKEYSALGYNYTPSQEYSNNLKKGIIIQEIDAEDNRSFKPFVNNPGFIDLINVNGEVLVGEQKLVFISDKINIYNKAGVLIDEVDFSSNAKATSNWSQGGSWIYDGDTKRYYCKVFGSSITSSETTEPGLLSATFYADALAENRRFGIWGSRSSYMPIYSFSGTWSSYYQARSCYLCSSESNPFNLPDGDYSSPFSWSSVNDPNGQTNHFLRYFKPNGSWQLPDGWYVSAPFSVTYNMLFSISWGTSGYYYQLSQ